MTVTLYKNTKSGSITINPGIWVERSKETIGNINSADKLLEYVNSGNSLLIENYKQSNLRRHPGRYTITLAKRDFNKFAKNSTANQSIDAEADKSSSDLDNNST